ncbi:hypothetical protein [Mycolicibacterium rhodesiae]|uniref:PE-PPE domain-containing protein n=1 Tax=Mycolicibacterium rhodesiae TaxID=36814 RepID=A0A1X0IL14_MYCRH|nr:hypothetical protein [Mycolicibacterium rhodesiae]MCV7348486.1 hypothetical protein [Mycolicibacterium rhodesiae]ORB48479.1 hypothetical protein BST42_25325 [Mycolicibacterium rhodesiae]
MDIAIRRCTLAAATLTTAGALALTPVTVAPPSEHAPVRVSTLSVQLTDAWSQLFSDTASNVTDLVVLALGVNNSYPLPSPTIPLAPVVTQLALNQLAYAGLLLTGQGGQIPAWIGAHLTEVGKVAQLAVSAIPGVVLEQLRTPFSAAAQTLQYITGSANPVGALFQAPAVFLNIVLNSQYGLLGFTGPIGLPLIFRNLLTTAIYTPLPSVVLPFKKPASAAVEPKAAASTAAVAKVTAPSGTASSARSKPKAPSQAASGKRKPSASTKTDTNGSGAGRGHSKRG